MAAEEAGGQLTEESARRLAAEKYNAVTCGVADIGLVAKSGLRCLVMGWSQGPPNWIGESIPPEVAKTLANDPAVLGFFVTDEPDNKNTVRGTTFPQLRDRIAAYRAAAPNKLAWVNKLSGGGSTLTQYMETLQPDFLSYDWYRWWWGESGWWLNLEVHRAAALKYDVPMMVWIEQHTDEKLATARLPPPPGNAEKVRWSVYSSVAYGAKGIQWFIARPYQEIAALNAELTALGPTLIKLTSRNVFHTSDVPWEGRRLPLSSWYSTDAKNLLIGEFTRADEPNTSYLLIANKSIETATDFVCWS